MYPAGTLVEGLPVAAGGTVGALKRSAFVSFWLRNRSFPPCSHRQNRERAMCVHSLKEAAQQPHDLDPRCVELLGKDRRQAFSFYLCAPFEGPL